MTQSNEPDNRVPATIRWNMDVTVTVIKSNHDDVQDLTEAKQLLQKFQLPK